MTVKLIYIVSNHFCEKIKISLDKFQKCSFTAIFYYHCNENPKLLEVALHIKH